jgi:hypothetical protein
MEGYRKEQVIFDGTGVLQAVFTAAITNIITSNGHGYTGGERLQFTTADTLPAGLSLTTDYFVIASSVTTNTFKVSAVLDGAEVDITDTGTGVHTMHLKGKVLFVEGYKDLFLSLNTSGTATFTVKVQGSYSDTMPDFSAAQSTTNRWDYITLKDMEDASAIDGDTGIAPAGADDNRQFMVNVNQLKWLTVNKTAWTQGKIRVAVAMSNNI